MLVTKSDKHCNADEEDFHSETATNLRPQSIPQDAASKSGHEPLTAPPFRIAKEIDKGEGGHGRAAAVFASVWRPDKGLSQMMSVQGGGGRGG